MADTAEYDEKTQDELRKILDARALPVSGTKAEQIKRLEDDDKAKAKTGNSANANAQADPATADNGDPNAKGQAGSTTPELGGEPAEKGAQLSGNTAATDDGVAANHDETRISGSEERVGDTGPERGGVQAIEFERAKAEKEERENVVEFAPATYKNGDASLLLSEIAEELGLTRPSDYAELTRLNGIDLTARVDKGEEVRLPQQYSYVDVDHVSGGAVKS